MINDNELLVNKNQIYILNVPDSKPVKIIFEEYPCPNDPTYRCKHSNFTNKEEIISIWCDLAECVKA